MRETTLPRRADLQRDAPVPRRLPDNSTVSSTRTQRSTSLTDLGPYLGHVWATRAREMTRNSAKSCETPEHLRPPVSLCFIRVYGCFPWSDSCSAGRTRTYNQWINSPPGPRRLCSRRHTTTTPRPHENAKQRETMRGVATHNPW